MDFLTGGGQMANVIAAMDWRTSPLGPPSGWSQALRSTMGLILPAQAEIVLFWGPDYAALYNDAYVPTIGAKHPAALGRPARENWSELWDDLEPLLRGVRETGETLAASDRPFYIERHGVGETVYFDISYSAVREADGSVGGVLCIVRETTAQVHAKRQLTDERERLVQLFQQAPSFMALMEGPSHTFTFVNPAYQQLIGHRDVIGRNIRDALPEVVAQGFPGLLDRAYRTGESVGGRDVLVALQRTPGAPPETRILDFVYQPLKNAAGDVTGIFVEGTDVTEEAQARIALKEESRALDLLNGTAAKVAAELDLNRLVQTVVDAGVALSGAEFGAFFYNVVDTKGESYMLYALSGADPAAFSKFPMPRNTQVFAPTFAGEGIVRSGDITSDPRYGQNTPRKGMPEGHLPVRSYLAVPVVSRSGEVIGGLFFGHARTDVFDANAERLMTGLAAQAAIGIDNARLFQAEQRLNQTLESRVEDRTRELLKAQQALQQVQKMEAIGSLTGGIAHDFNNLLMAVTGSLELLRKRVPDEPGLLRLIDNAMAGARRGSSLTRRMLAFARRQDLKSERIDITALVAGMTELLQRALGPSVHVKTDFPARLPAVETDPNQLESALLNLSVNARDAMQGEGEIVISARAMDVTASETGLQPGHYVCLSVANSGEGMDEDTLKRATEPFFTTKGVGKGTGLGLSMVHGLAEQSGGTLVLHSRKGAGTTAEIWLPAAGDAVEVTLAAAPVLAQPVPPRDAMHILAIDDDPLVLMNTADMLEDLGHVVTPVNSAADALVLLRSGREFDMVITDHAMPQMTGSQFAQEASRERPNLKVLLATGYAELPSGADIGLPRLSKPFTQADLVEAIARLFAH